MRNGVSWNRRAAAFLALTVTMLVVTGSGAGAAGISTYNAQASANTLSLSVQLPMLSALSGVLSNLQLQNGIQERVSFSSATADVTGTKSAGTALSQVLFGNLLANTPVAQTAVNGAHDAQQQMAAVDLPSAAQPLVHIGIGQASSASHTVGNAVYTTSKSTLIGVKVDLRPVLNMQQIQQLLAPVTNVLDGTSSNPAQGVIPQLDQALATLSQTLKAQGINTTLSVPQISSFLDKPLLDIGIIESISDTHPDGAARTAKGITHLANVDILGGFIHIDAINIESFASIDGTAQGAQSSAVQRIVGLHVGGNVVDLNAGSLNVLGHVIALPTNVKDMLNLTVDALGLKVILAPAPQRELSATHARSAASSLHVELAPGVAGNRLFSIALDGPAAVADVRGGNVLGVKEIRIPTTGMNDTTMWMVGAMLLGLGLAGRKFVLSK